MEIAESPPNLSGEPCISDGSSGGSSLREFPVLFFDVSVDCLVIETRE